MTGAETWDVARGYITYFRPLQSIVSNLEVILKPLKECEQKNDLTFQRVTLVAMFPVQRQGWKRVINYNVII